MSDLAQESWAKRFLPEGVVVVIAAFLAQLHTSTWLWILTIVLMIGGIIFQSQIEKRHWGKYVLTFFLMYLPAVTGYAILNDFLNKPRLFATLSDKPMNDSIITKS